MDGTTYTQSTALLRYVGKLAGLLPEDPLEALKVRRSIPGNSQFCTSFYAPSVYCIYLYIYIYLSIYLLKTKRLLICVLLLTRTVRVSPSATFCPGSEIINEASSTTLAFSSVATSNRWRIASISPFALIFSLLIKWIGSMLSIDYSVIYTHPCVRIFIHNL